MEYSNSSPEQKEYISQKIGKELEVIRIAEKDPERLKSVPDSFLGKIAVSSDAADVYKDPEVDIVVELIGGVEPAFDFVSCSSEGKEICSHCQ